MPGVAAGKFAESVTRDRQRSVCCQACALGGVRYCGCARLSALGRRELVRRQGEQTAQSEE